MAFPFQVVPNKKPLTKQFADSFWQYCADFPLKDLDTWYKNAYSDVKLGQVLLDESVFDFSVVIDPTFLTEQYEAIVQAFGEIGTFSSIETMIKAIFGEEVTISFSDGDIDPAIEQYHLNVEIYETTIDFYQWKSKDGRLIGDDDGNQILFKTVFSYLNAEQARFVLSSIIAAGIYANFTFYTPTGDTARLEVLGVGNA